MLRKRVGYNITLSLLSFPLWLRVATYRPRDIVKTGSAEIELVGSFSNAELKFKCKQRHGAQ